MAIAQINTQEAANGVNVLLGGSCIHNSTTFLEDLLQLHKPQPNAERTLVFEEKTERESL